MNESQEQPTVVALGDGSVVLSGSAADLDAVSEWLVALIEGGHFAARERAKAGDVLGQLGDPRFDPDRLYFPCRYRGEEEPLSGFVKIPEGPFMMGSQKGDEEAAPDWFGNPRDMVIPYSYWMARYPVTVAQFRVFLEAGGYDSPDWWSEAGRVWRSGDWHSPGQDEETVDWLKQRPAPLRNRPMWWDEQHTYSNRPVVGVSWFESTAYCCWLDAQVKAAGAFPRPDGYVVRLSTEAEWEKAARCADDRRYPWGNQDWDEERANIGPSEIGHATAVGMYPRGASPSGIHDLSGNVWEWTYSLNRPYPYDPRDGRNDQDSGDHRRMRGSSWLFDERCARCSARGGGPPDHYNDVVGFRVVISTASPEL